MSKLLPDGLTREEAYEERIAHLRTGIEMLQEAQHSAARIISPDYPRTTLGTLLLDQDVDRSIEQDGLS